jgi:hypothetical protein
MTRFPLTYMTLFMFTHGFDESIIATQAEALMQRGGTTEDVCTYLAIVWPTWSEHTVEVAS